VLLATASAIGVQYSVELQLLTFYPNLGEIFSIASPQNTVQMIKGTQNDRQIRPEGWHRARRPAQLNTGVPHVERVHLAA
jgi:hypothetical protein